MEVSAPWIIIGDGLAGCTVAMSCLREGIDFRLVGAERAGAASLASSGLINPITGRRYTRTWMADVLLDHAADFYRWTEQELPGSFFRSVEIVRFLSTPEAVLAWEERAQDPAYDRYVSGKRYDFLDTRQQPYGIVTGAFVLDTPAWIKAVREVVQARGKFLPGRALGDGLAAPHGPVIRAQGVFADPLPKGIIPNKGEALIVRMPEWPLPIISKSEVFVVPLAGNDTYWVGSGYARWPADGAPTNTERERLLHVLHSFHDGPVDVLAHLAGVRPTTADRRPLIGADPDHPGDYIFNGMGTKGTSLAPYWAKQLIAHIRGHAGLAPDVDPARFLA